MPIRVILRKPIQYLIAKSTLALYASIPFILIAIYFYQLRQQTIANIVGQWEFGLLLLFCIIGVAVFSKRESISKSIDQRFFRNKVDHQLLLFDLNNSIRNSVGEDDLYHKILKIVQDAVHAKVCFLYLLDNSSGQYRNAMDREEVLDLRCSLIDRISQSSNPIYTTEDQHSLAAESLQWLQQKEIELILPLTSSNGKLMAFGGLGEKHSELKYTSDELKLLQSLIGPMVLAMENQNFRTSTSPATPNHTPRSKSTAGLCYYCSQCGVVTSDRTKSCCGAKLIPSQLPFAIHTRFHLEKFLGEGKSGEVYLAYDIDLMRRVALKTLHATSADEAHLLRQESVAAAATNHKNIATIYDALVWQQTPILVFEYLAMGTLSQQIKKGPLAIAEVIKLGVALSDALGHLHSKDILHRDIKPANVGYTVDLSPKIMDFGLARVSRKHNRKERLNINDLSIEETRTTINNHQWIGTPLYWSPETIEGQAPGPWTDTWALCTVLYESLTGAHPFLKETWPESMQLITSGEVIPPNSVRRDCPVELSELLVRGLQKSRNDRLSTAEDLQKGFQRLSHLYDKTVAI
jgi:tRNA A-37 threonylcarbamoyl transferase component Bud32